jgi:hypothetical protein
MPESIKIPADPTTHEHQVLEYSEMLIPGSGYDARTRGYVYTFKEWCSCGASRMKTYMDAHSAGAAHEGATERKP